MTTPIDTIHDVIHEWIQQATGLADGKIIPANETVMSTEPTGDYI